MKSDDLGKLVLRLALGILILLHGIAKLNSGVGGIAGMLSSHGLPGVLAYLVLVGEIVAPVLLIAGIFSRLGAIIIATNIVMAIVLVHMGQLTSMTQTGGWALELQGMFLFSAIALACLGAGRVSVGGLNGRWN